MFMVMTFWVCLAKSPPLHACSFPALQHLDVSACRRVCGGDLRGLADMRALRSIVLSGCEDVGDEGLAHLAALAGLTSLNLANCCKVRRSAGRGARAGGSEVVSPDARDGTVHL
jgi:hypothetical protein